MAPKMGKIVKRIGGLCWAVSGGSAGGGGGTHHIDAGALHEPCRDMLSYLRSSNKEVRVGHQSAGLGHTGMDSRQLHLVWGPRQMGAVQQQTGSDVSGAGVWAVALGSNPLECVGCTWCRPWAVGTADPGEREAAISRSAEFSDRVHVRGRNVDHPKQWGTAGAQKGQARVSGFGRPPSLGLHHHHRCVRSPRPPSANRTGRCLRGKGIHLRLRPCAL